MPPQVTASVKQVRVYSKGRNQRNATTANSIAIADQNFHDLTVPIKITSPRQHGVTMCHAVLIVKTPVAGSRRAIRTVPWLLVR